MERQHRISNLRKAVLALSVSTIALSVTNSTAIAQELTERPSTTVLVYNIWNKNAVSAFWKNGNHINGFTDRMIQFLKDVKPDTIVYPELDNNLNPISQGATTKFADRFVGETARALNDADGARTYRQLGTGLTISRYASVDLGGRRATVKPGDGFPDYVINGIHLNYADNPASGRLAQAKELNQFVASHLLPVISAGDYNAADVSERGLLSADQQLKSFARDLSSASPIGASALNQYARNPEHRALLASEAAYWRERVSVGGAMVPRYQSVVPNWSSSSWDTSLRHITAAMLARNPAIAFDNETYPVPINIPVTLNILKQGNQLLQQQRNREIFANSTLLDGHSTWTSDGRDEENVWQWWDRSVIDHIIASRPYAKWMGVDAQEKFAGILNGLLTNDAGVDPSDHEPVAQKILWHGPKLTTDNTSGMADLGFSKEDRTYNANGEFILSRNNHRTDVRFDNISDDNGSPIYRDDVNAVGKLGRQLLNDQVSELISKGLLAPQEGLDYVNDPNAALKMRIPCDNKAVLETIVGAAALCVDNHSKFNALDIQDGVVAFDESAALGNITGTITLSNGGLRSAGPADAWAQWGATPVTVIDKAIVLGEGVGSFEVSDPEGAIALNGAISGEGSFEKRGEGTLTLNGENSYEGATIVNGGVLRAGSSDAFGQSGIFDLRRGRLDIGETQILITQLIGDTGAIDIGTGALGLMLDGDRAFAGSFSGGGLIVKGDPGRLTINGQNPHQGQFLVVSGSLVVGDKDHPEARLSSEVFLNEGTKIGGIGSIGSLLAASGSVIAPGNSVGTLRIDGDLNVQTGATFVVELSSDGSNDRIDVGGQARLLGGVVEALPLDPETSYIDGQSYRLLNADQGVEGQFERINSDTAFLDLSLIYAPKSVDLMIKVKHDKIFSNVAETENEQNVAESLGTLEQRGESLHLFNEVLPLSETQARPAFNALSGEIYASVNGALIDDSRFARQAANKRLLSNDKGEGVTFWSHAYGAWGRTKSDGNAATLDRNVGGLFVGGDVEIADNWQLGVFGGYGASSFEAKSRVSKADVDSYTLGAYTGTWFDPIGIRIGVANSWHRIDVVRSVEFGRFSESLSSSYDARTLQLFGEVSSKLDVGGIEFEPFAGLAYAKLDGDSYAEQGVSALRGISSGENATYSTLGFRLNEEFEIGATKAVLKGSAAWQHAFGPDVPSVQQQFATGSILNVAGVPIAKNSALLEVGYDWLISDTATLGIVYQGQIGSGVQNHGVNAKLQLHF